MATPTHSASMPAPSSAIPPLQLPEGSLKQILPDFKKPTKLHYTDPNFSPVSQLAYLMSLLSHSRLQEEKRSRDPKYYFKKEGAPAVAANEETRGKKRARAEDFL